MKKIAFLLVSLVFVACTEREHEKPLRLWYDEPAMEWTEALPIGNGRIGAMVFGGVEKERIQFNEETLWTGYPRDYSRAGAHEYLPQIRQLLFEGKQKEAEQLAGEHFMGLRSNEAHYDEEMAQWMSEVRDVAKTYADPAYDDRGWESLKFPNKKGWESVGFPGLDGSIWLRFTFDAPAEWEGKNLVLNLGRIRDTDFTYFNGTFINTETNRYAHRRYEVPARLVNKGKNVIAIQIINYYDDGGLVGFKTGEPLVVYPQGGDFEEGIPLDVAWKYLIQNSDIPEYPQYQASYQPFGDLWLEFEGMAAFTNYTRELNLEKAISKTSYEVDGVIFTREYFVSSPDQAMVVHLTASEKGAVDFSAWLTSPHQGYQVTPVDQNTQRLDVQVTNGALKGASALFIDAKGGEVSWQEGKLSVSSADEATIYLTAATNFKRFDDISADPVALAKSDLSKVVSKPSYEVKADHIRDYKSYFDRFSIELGDNQCDSLTTDKRIVSFAKNNDPSLVALYVQYGRYLAISTSRPGTRPPNLQGIWNDQLTPPWGSKYTTNINCEMNYWPVEVLNLSELHEPLFTLIEEVAERGKITAKEHYNVNGWVLHHNTDLWRGTAPINHANHGIWVTGGAWLCEHLWQHFLYTNDTAFLKERAYPLMKGAASFFQDFLIEDPETGYVISTPSNSPETGGLVAGPTMDHQIIRSLFANVADACEVLDIDRSFADSLKGLSAQIAPNRIGQYGQLQEWMQDKDDPENHHRHVSHLWGLYPGNKINTSTPELMQAARKSLGFRGDDGTGWSLAWKINFWARLGDGSRAWRILQNLLRPAWGEDKRGGGSYKNLFDAHPPFQIDGNFGAAAGVAEMFAQSRGDTVVLLPALSEALPDGRVEGLKLRGGLELDIEWNNLRLDSFTVYSALKRNVVVQYQGVQTTINLRSGVHSLHSSQLNHRK